MKGSKMIWLAIPALILVVMLGALVLRGWQSQSAPETGLVDGHLRLCPDKPNCVSSEAGVQDRLHAIAPLGTSDWQALKQAVQQAGGTINADDGHYLHATFTSAMFRFVDDVEMVRDAAGGAVHIRSASRVGYSDFGVNRKRVEAIRERLEP